MTTTCPGPEMARPRLRNYHPQHLLSRPSGHAGLRSRRDGSGAIVRTTSLRLQQKGQEALPGPLAVPTKCRYLQEIYKWAMLDLNQRPPPCKGGALPLS